MRYLAILLFLPSLAFAQTIDQPALSIRALFGYGLSVKAQMEATSTTGNQVLAGSPMTVMVSLITDDYVLMKLPGNKTATAGPVTATSLRMTFTPIMPTTVKTKLPAYAASEPLSSPMIVPVGGFLGCRYFMPWQRFDLTTAQPKVKDTPGWLRCSVNVEPAAIPINVAIVVGTILPAPVLTPPPAPTQTADSLTGDCIGTQPAGFGCTRLIDPPLVASGIAWTLASGVPLKAGAATSTAYSGSVVSLIRTVNSLRLVSSNGVYQCWNGSAWGDVGC